MRRFFEEEVVYQIYPRSFQDSNGDGIGDLNGIISRLDYLRELGVKILWLSPIYASPNADYGYDISDYFSINPEFGTMDDFERLISEAKKRGIRIVMDLVVNHTSNKHQWFIASKNENSPYRSYYYWRKGRKDNKLPPNNWTSNFGGSAWTYVEEADAWYLHLFTPEQPDLDWHNPKVLEEVEKILRFYLDKGVYGFRCDVINQIYKESLADGKRRVRTIGLEHYLQKENNHQILHTLYEDVFSHYDCMTVGETGGVDFKNARRFTNEELDMVFQFDTINSDSRKIPLFAPKMQKKRFKRTLFAWQKELDWNAVCFENHDQRRSLPRFGDPKKYPYESGSMLATLLLTMRGTPFIYQGEEIGMTNYKNLKPEEYKDVVGLYIYSLLRKMHLPKKTAERVASYFNRDNARSPMQWNGEINAGFSTGVPWLPVNGDYQEVNVLKEQNDEESIYKAYKTLLKLRREDDVLRYGTFEETRTKSSFIAYYRLYEGGLRFVIANLTGHRVKLPQWIKRMRGEVLYSNYCGAGFLFKKVLRPYEALIIKIR